MDVDLGALPEMRSYAATVPSAGPADFDGTNFPNYVQLPEGVSTISVNSQRSDLTVNLATEPSRSTYYATKEAPAGASVVMSSVAVPKGQTRFLRVDVKTACDVGVTIITYPLA